MFWNVFLSVVSKVFVLQVNLFTTVVKSEMWIANEHAGRENNNCLLTSAKNQPWLRFQSKGNVNNKEIYSNLNLKETWER